MENNENPIPAKQTKNSLALILTVIGSVLIIGNLYFYVARQKRNTIKRQQLDSLAKQLDTANAKFEISINKLIPHLSRGKRFGIYPRGYIKIL